MEVWPPSLQQKLLTAGFNYQFGSTKVSSEMDVGPKKVRARFTDAVDVYTCQVHLDFDEIQTFKDFYKVTLGGGTLPFEFVDPFTEEVTAFRFTPDGDPAIQPLGGRFFSLSMVWEKIP